MSEPIARGRRALPLAAAALSAALVLSACGAKKTTAASGGNGGNATASSSGTGGSPSCGQVTINENSWVGSAANVYVVKNVLEKNLGCTVKVSQIAEIPVYQAMADGKVDTVLEDWQHTDEYKKYEKQLGVVQDAGSNGVTGHIGWYTPSYVVQQHPEMATWKGLKQDWKLFQTSESGNQGELLDGDPSYVTNDAALVKNLGLNLKVVYAGGEASQITQVKQAIAQKKPILFYWYTPQWFNATTQLTEVKLPPRTPGCDADPKKVNCAYPTYDLRKLISTQFAKSGSPAVKVIKNFKWTAADQEAVSVSIAQDKMSPDAAAKKWIDANGSKVQAWLSGS